MDEFFHAIVGQPFEVCVELVEEKFWSMVEPLQVPDAEDADLANPLTMALPFLLGPVHLGCLLGPNTGTSHKWLELWIA